MRLGRFALTLVLLLVASVCVAQEVDPYLWLEEVDGDSALAWVEERSAKDTADLEAVPEFAPIHKKLIELYNSSDRIPYPQVLGPWIYNFWQDEEHVRGIWRRTTRDSVHYRLPQLGNGDRPGQTRRGRGRELGVEGRQRPGAGLQTLHGSAVARRW